MGRLTISYSGIDLIKTEGQFRVNEQICFITSADRIKLANGLFSIMQIVVYML